MVLSQTYPRRRARRLRQEIREGTPDGLTEEDQEALLEFDEQLMRDRKRNRRCGWSHHASLLHDLLSIAKETQVLAQSLEDGEAGEEAVDEMTFWVHQNKDPEELEDKSPYTVQSQLSAIRNFAATTMDVDFDDLPERFAEIEPGEWEDDHPAPLPSEVLRFGDLIRMVREVDSIRDVALLMVQWALGLRPQKELWTLKRKHIEFHDDCAKITLPNQHGKGDRRTLIVTVGWTALQKWVEEEHPAHKDPEQSMDSETYIWTRNSENTHLNYGSLAARFYAAGERAEISTKHSPQHFRRSSASILAGKPHVTERDLRKRYSWAPTSFAPEHYIQVHSLSTQQNVARARGIELDDMAELEDDAEVTPVVCPDCMEWTERGLDECVWCLHNLEDEQATIKTSPTIKNPDTVGEKSVKELIFDGDITPAEMRTVLELEPHIRSDPEFFQKVKEYLPRAQALHDADSDLIGGGGIVGNTVRASVWAGSVAKGWAKAKHVAMSIHPAFEEYPLRGRDLATFFVGCGMIIAMSLAVISWSGLLSEILAGEPTALVSLVIALLLGAWLINRDLPDVDEAVDAVAQDAD